MLRFRWALVLVAAAAVVLLGFTAYQGVRARTSLQRVDADVVQLRVQLLGGDQAAARSTLRDMQGHAREARQRTRGPGWWLLSKTPGVAPNVLAARTVADVSDVLAHEVLPDVVAASGALQPDSLRPVKGRIDLAPMLRVTPAVVSANARLMGESTRVQAIGTEDLAPQLAAPVRQLQARLAEAAGMSTRASQAVRLLPPMLGAEGRRTYLLMFQNNAEVRATGGIPGAFAVVHADDGRLSFGRQETAGSVGRFDKPVLRLTAWERGLFGDRLGVYPQDVNFTPDFPRTATVMQAMWKARTGTTVDGVLSTDPVALSHLLQGTGPIHMDGGRALAADDVVRVLLNEVYLDNPEPQRQDEYFGRVARTVFDAVASAQGDPTKVLAALSRSAAERRLLVWSDDADEQAIIAPTPVGGALPTGDGKVPQVGVYLNDGSQAKLDYYLDYDTDVTSTRCASGRQRLIVTVHMWSRLPRRTRALTPVLATAHGLPSTTMRTTVMAYAPVDGTVDSFRLNGTRMPLMTRAHSGRPMVAQTVDLEQGQRATATYTMTSGPGQTNRANVQVTPGVRGDGIGTISPSACAS